jgi:hypothetical protein
MPEIVLGEARQGFQQREDKRWCHSVLRTILIRYRLGLTQSRGRGDCSRWDKNILLLTGNSRRWGWSGWVRVVVRVGSQCSELRHDAESHVLGTGRNLFLFEEVSVPSSGVSAQILRHQRPAPDGDAGRRER